MVYSSFSEYLNARCSNDLQRLESIRKIIDALYNTAFEAAERGVIREYSIDSGQSKITTGYRSAKEVEASIQSFERLEQRLQQRVYGTRLVRLRPAQGSAGRAI